MMEGIWVWAAEACAQGLCLSPCPSPPPPGLVQSHWLLSNLLALRYHSAHQAMSSG